VLPNRLRALVLVLLAVGPLVVATLHASHGTRYTEQQDTTYDDTTTGAIPHPEAVFAVGSAPMQQAIALAKAHWGTNPCGGNVDIVWDGLDAEINAQSTWSNPRSPYDNADLNNDCKVEFNQAASFDWPKFCTVTIHEFGHLSGKPHSPDANDIMAAYYNKPAPECVANTPAQFQAAPAPAAQPPARAASVVRRASAAKKATKKKVVHKKRRSRARRHASRRR
jgi:hypothetical protein